MSNQSKRDRLVESAAVLFHQNGLSTTSLADIAKHAEIPIGNVYYYFKTKEELALAAVTRRQEQFKAAYALLDENIADPRQRLIEAVGYFAKVREEYTRHGCPVGKIIADADTGKNNVAQTASQVLEDFTGWAQRQFSLLGHGDNARRYAHSLIAAIEGAALIAKAFRNPQVIADEMERLQAWIESLPNKRIQLGKVGQRSGETTTAA